MHGATRRSCGAHVYFITGAFSARYCEQLLAADVYSITGTCLVGVHLTALELAVSV